SMVEPAGSQCDDVRHGHSIGPDARDDRDVAPSDEVPNNAACDRGEPTSDREGGDRSVDRRAMREREAGRITSKAWSVRHAVLFSLAPAGEAELAVDQAHSDRRGTCGTEDDRAVAMGVSRWMRCTHVDRVREHRHLDGPRGSLIVEMDPRR